MKCDRDGCPNQAAKMERYCKDALCIRVREAVAKRAADKATPKRETGPIVSRDEETAKAASAPKPTQAEVLAAVQATKAGTLPNEGTESIHDEEPKQPKQEPKQPKKKRRTSSRAVESQGRYGQAIRAAERSLLEAALAAGVKGQRPLGEWLGASPTLIDGMIARTGLDRGRFFESKEEQRARAMRVMERMQERKALERLIARAPNLKIKAALEAALAALEAES